MPIKTKILVTFLASFALLGSAGAAQARGLTSPEASLLQTMNAVRTSHGLPPLRVDVHLLRAARAHSADMMRRQYFAHGSVEQRALSRGAHGPVFGEDLAWATGITANWVVNAWLASPTHRAVLLRPGFRRVGIGYSFGTFIGHGGAGVVTADFAGR
jgi:uncharacterized protein YkwD